MHVPPKPLSNGQRAADLERMAASELDLVVIGGGVTGAGVALDAASRGLSVGLVEQRDYASGTSSRSSKLLHGGLRYLEQMEFGLVREALAERNLMLNHLCPHLARPVSFVYPLQHRVWERAYVGSGVLLYDGLASLADSPLPHPEHLSHTALLELAPGVDPASAIGGIRYWDAQVDDARHTMMIARTAASLGVAMAPSTRVVGLLEGDGRVGGVEALSLESRRTFPLRARKVINATGVWSGDLQRMASDRGLTVEASKGIHLVVAKDRIRSDTGLILRTEKSVLFVIPWGEFWIVGTTDTPWTLRRAHPAASRADIDYLLRWANSVLADDLTHADVIGVYAGLRPLLKGESDETSKLSREHAVLEAENGLVSIAGGKYTTYRVMAEDAVDVAFPDAPPSTTDDIPLVGAEGFADLVGSEPTHGLGPAAWERLLGRYGSLATEVLAPADGDPGLLEPVVDDAPYLRAEILYATTHEGALHLDDTLTRRTRLSIETSHRGVDAVEATADLMGGVLGWSDQAREDEVAHYLARVEAERDSQEQEDDRTADAARMGAPDVRTGESE